MSNLDDHTQSTTDLLPTPSGRRHRTLRHRAATPPTAQPPQNPTTPQNPSAPQNMAGTASPRTAGPALGNTYDSGTATPHHDSSENNPTPVAEPRAPHCPLPRPLAEVVTIRQGTRIEHELVIAPGATAADVTTVMITISPSAVLVGHRTGADVSLLFREAPGGAERDRASGRTA